MLRLLLFVPCEKVIVAENGQTSAVGIIETIRVQMDAADPVPSDALIPFRWGFLTLWSRDESINEPTRYQSQIRILRPDGSDAGFQAESEFEVTVNFKNFRQHNDQIPVFPAGQEGRYELKLFLRKAGEEEWEQRGLFPIIVEHIKPHDESQK